VRLTEACSSTGHSSHDKQQYKHHVRAHHALQASNPGVEAFNYCTREYEPTDIKIKGSQVEQYEATSSL